MSLQPLHWQKKVFVWNDCSSTMLFLPSYNGVNKTRVTKPTLEFPKEKQESERLASKWPQQEANRPD